MQPSSFQADEALRLFENGPMVLFKWKAAEQWPVEYVSSNVTQFGYEPADFTSGRIPYAAIVHPDDLARVAEEVRQHSEAGDSFFEQTYRILDRRGQVRWLYDFTVVARDEQNRITHFYGYILDITARRQAQEAAQESMAKYKAIVEAYDGFLYICSEDFKLEFLNQRLLNYLGRNAVGEPCHRAIFGREGVCPWCPSAGAVREKTVHWEVLHPRDKRWYYVNQVRLTHPNGRRSRMGMITDITERKQAETTLRRREAILETIGFASEQFLKSESWESCIQAVLERAGQAIGVQRVSFSEVQAVPGNEVVAERRAEWTASGVGPLLFSPDWRTRQLRAQGFGRWIEQLGRGRSIVGRVSEFPASEKALLEAQKIGSMIVLPVFVGAQWQGYLAFSSQSSERAWLPVEIDGLKTIADLLGAAMLRQQTEQDLRRSEERSATLLHAIPDLIFRLDPQGVLLDLKTAPGADLPPPQTLLGRKLTDFLPEPVVRRFLEGFARLAATGQAQVFETTLAPDATRVYEVHLAKGIKGELLAILRDITARKKADAAIAKLAAFPLYNPNPVFEFAEDGTVLFCNQAAQNLARVLGQDKPQQLLPPDVQALVRECSSSGSPRSGVTTTIGGHLLRWSFLPIPETRTVHGYGVDMTACASDTPPA